MSNRYKEIIYSYYGKTTKIKFDWSSVSMPKIKKAYKIHQDEILIAYSLGCMNIFPLHLDGIVLTDKALYTHPCHKTNNTNRLTYDSLYLYEILFKDTYSNIILKNSLNVFVVFTESMLSQSVATTEYYELLTELRKISMNGKSTYESKLREKKKGSWFSELAHLDEHQLNKEYRVLVKKYHPDVNPEIDTSMMVSINNEHDEILKKMKL